MKDHNTVDLTNCDKVPIHLLGRVQSFGFLIAVTKEWSISHVSKNVSDYIPYNADDLLGKPINNLFADETLHEIKNKLQYLTYGGGAEVLSDVCFNNSEKQFDISVHPSNGNIILDCEPHQGRLTLDDDLAAIRGAANRLKRLPNLDRFYTNTVRFVKLLVEMDRVMLYKFLPDGTGEVIAEEKNPEIDESFIGLRYPATDIPKQARQLYIQNPFRIISNSSEYGHEILTHQSASDHPLDLSGSVLRSVSPIHIEYLQNMGVKASMSISIIIDGKLWGLIACHNYSEPKTITQSKRNSAILFGQMLSLLLNDKLTDLEKENRLTAKKRIEEANQLNDEEITEQSKLAHFAKSFMPELNADGAVVVYENSTKPYGAVPSPESITDIIDFLKTQLDNAIFETNDIQSHIKNKCSTCTGGIIAVPISRLPADYIIYFRKKAVQKITWAGNPDKPVTDGEKLSPRKSFEAWQEIIENKSDEWTDAELEICKQLRITLLEIILRASKDIADVRKTEAEKQEVLIAELNHRVRNILGLVRGLISQTSSNKHSVEDFIDVLDNRIQSLARAHDQITKHNWAPASLKQLIKVEAESYLVNKMDRVLVSGEEALLNPTAFSTMALVLHEMLVNALKYGALADSTGKVTIDLTKDINNNLTIKWTETGGPLILKTPERRGFGSGIIERSIPFELKGEVDIKYLREGVSAIFKIPSDHITYGTAEVTDAEPQKNASANEFQIPENVLIVEDNLIIAMEAEDVFQNLGVQKTTLVSSNDQAITHLNKETVDFALLDVNLGSENSIPTAKQLKKMGIPFIFATGYGEMFDRPDFVTDIICISKPYDSDMINSALSKTFNGEKESKIE